MIERTYVAPWTRVTIVLAFLVAGFTLSYLLTGSLVPSEPSQALVFQNGLLLVVLGSALIEHKYTKPADSVINSLISVVTMITVYRTSPLFAWWSVAGYLLAVCVLATACVVASTDPLATGWRQKIASFTYRPAVVLGQARLVFSLVFLFGVFSFYGLQARETAIFVLFWGAFVVLWPLRIPELLSAWSPRRRTASIGRVVRTEWPNVVRAFLPAGSAWSPEKPAVYRQGDGAQKLVVPLYAQSQADGVLATGLCVDLDEPCSGLETGLLYSHRAPLESMEISHRLGGDDTSKLIGFVVEESSISELRFETWEPDSCREGMLVWSPIGDERVFYQVTDGKTAEESLEGDRRGFQRVFAAQIGALRSPDGFAKIPWLPEINRPVFVEPADFGKEHHCVEDGDFVYGTVPGSEIPVAGPFVDALDHHTAILGVTGSGKTELTLDLVKHSAKRGVKVICIDLTGQYEPRLGDHQPVDLSIDTELAVELDERLFEVDIGTWTEKDAKKRALQEYSSRLRQDARRKLEAFLTTADRRAAVGIITLEEISNTKATLAITEMYLSTLLHLARSRQPDFPRILLVVEEAHTTMPEPNTMGLGDWDSKGLVSKIAQIALQGRKYGVGLLVIAQRTATVSKTVLTQCNTIVSFNCFDETSIGFLENFYGKAYSRAVAQLPRLHAMVYGKAVRSERPIMVEIPFDEAKVQTTTARGRPASDT